MTSDADRFRISLRQLLLLTAGIAAMLVFAIKLPDLIGVAYENLRFKQFDSVLYQEQHFDLRITGLIEREEMLALAAPGTYYRYELRRHSFLSKWQSICQVSVPVAEPIPRDQFKRASNDVYYFFNSVVFGVTVNGGVDWVTVDVQNLPVQAPTESSYMTIESFSIQPSGKGEIVVSAIDGNSGDTLGSTALNSNDFGNTWSVKKQSRPKP